MKSTPLGNSGSILTNAGAALLLVTMTSPFWWSSLGLVAAQKPFRKTDIVHQAVMSVSEELAALKACNGDVLTNCNRITKSSSCSCNARTCRHYGTCCKTLQTAAATTVDTSRPSGGSGGSNHSEGNTTIKTNYFKNGLFSCINLHRLHGPSPFNGSWNNHVYIINRCPTSRHSNGSRTNAEAVAGCAAASQPDADLFFKLPVYGRQTLAFFANVYCAACNGESDIVYLKVEKHCGYKEDYEAGQCESLVERPSEVYIEYCRANLISSCPTNFTDRNTTRKCSSDENSTSYRSQRISIDGGRGGEKYRHFRNRHCAICHGLSEVNDTVCIRYTADSTGIGEIPPFSVLLDVSSGRLTQRYDQVGGSLVEVTDEVLTLERCPPGHIFDPFNQHCRQLFCPPRHQLTETGCVPSDEISPAGLNSTGFENSTSVGENTGNRTTSLGCSELRLDETEYRLDENGSLWSSLDRKSVSEQFFSADAYRIEINSETGLQYAFVCNIFTEVVYNTTVNVTSKVVMFEFDRIQSTISIIGSVLSVTALIIQLIVYLLLPSLRNTPGRCVMCLAVSLIVGQVLYLCVGLHLDADTTSGGPQLANNEAKQFDVAELEQHEPTDSLSGTVCFIQGVVMHFAFLASFCWMNVLAVDVYRTFDTTEVMSSSSASSWRPFMMYSLYAWGLPLFVVLFAVLLDLLTPALSSPDTDFWIRIDPYRPHYGRQLCWIGSRMALVAYFVVPIGVLWLANVVLFCVSGRHIYLASKAARPAQRTASGSSTRGLLLLYVKLSVIMGLTWGFGFLAALVNHPALWYPFIIFNTLQGVVICLSFTCTRRTLRLLADLFGCRRSVATTVDGRRRRGGDTPRTTVTDTTITCISRTPQQASTYGPAVKSSAVTKNCVVDNGAGGANNRTVEKLTVV